MPPQASKICMLNQASIDCLLELLDAPGPSGYERLPADRWRTAARTITSDVSADAHGNSVAVVDPQRRGPIVMLQGHIDEIGVIITHIDERGLCWIGPIGGWDPQVLVGQRIRFLGDAGPVAGVVGKKAIHVQKPDERDKASKMTDLWVDIGATSRSDAQARVAVGDPGVVEQPPLLLPNDRLVARATDNRVGAFIVLEALRRYAAAPGAATVMAAATTQEEISYQGGGAVVAATRLRPDLAFVVDVTHATDTPGIEAKEYGEHPLGSGPSICRGSVVSPVAVRLLRETAAARGIPYTLEASGSRTGTDADNMHVAGRGVAVGLVSIPNRYMHSPSEMVSLRDLDHAAELLAETCRRLPMDLDLTAR